ncbi:glycosyltransferase family 2 protein [Clostridium botulinum]|uniref:glycosyltransferase family 2 protein n=1 Tax=Clostridium botulinum TaxID=1491 RepID=UPI00330826D3|nr:glycosyltransferase [Clostridium botulinum]HDK7162373.1 glycosyltransferase [Clostridium botulinum]HDK7215833.1 glycosyltransferase [Clostridium botulinum]HDK7218325.1 glycosyltransferase [Clostridium botulinum]
MTMLYDRAAGLVSVIISAYNYDRYIIDTLESLKRQTYSNIEIILMDDCSQDNTKTIVNEWLTENADKFTDFIYVRLPRNLGFEWAVNIGLCLSKGEYVVFHDADDISHDEKIEKQVKYLQKHPNTAALGTVFSSFRDDISNVISTSNWISFDANEIERNYKFDIKHCVCYGTLMIRAYIIDEIIGFNKAVLFSNDFFFVSNIVHHGFIVENLNENLYFYRNHDKQFSRSLYEDDTVTHNYKEKRKKNEGQASIVVPIKGISDKVKETLKSIASQTYDNLELVIIDEQPDIDTEDIIRKWAEPYKNNGKFKDLVYFPLPREVGFPWIYNIGAYLSKGEFTAFHNIGGKSHQKRIEKQIEFLRNNFMYSVVGTNYNDSGNYIKFKDDIEYSYTVDFMPCMNFNTLLFRSDIIDKTGGMNKRIDGAEDFEFIFNLLHNGYRVENLSDILYYQ